MAAEEATAQVRVTSAICGDELLPVTAVRIAGLPEEVRALLGSRPSRPVTLFY